jgi:hypothetical protein
MVVGDQFLIRTMNEVLTYQVDQILIVEPTDLSSLLIESGEDFCTLVTCTPYGINTHRLLVRGHRVETVIEDTKSIRVSRRRNSDFLLCSCSGCAGDCHAYPPDVWRRYYRRGEKN